MNVESGLAHVGWGVWIVNMRGMASGGLHPDRSRWWMRRIWPMAARHRKAYAVSAAAGLLGTVATVSVPAVAGRGVDAVASGGTPHEYAAVLALLAAAHLGFGFVYRCGLFRSAHHIEAELRDSIYRRLAELSFSYWDRTQTGQVISRANSDVRSIQLIFAFVPIVAVQLVRLAMGVAAMLVLSPRLTLAAVAPLPLVLYLGMRLRRKVFPLSWVMQARSADVAAITGESIQGAQIVRLFAQERRQVELLARAARRLRWAGDMMADTRARHSPAMEAMPKLALALVLLVGGLAAIDSPAGVGDIVAFNAYVMIMAGPFSMISFVLVQWQRAAASAQRVFEILDERPEISDPPDAQRLSAPQGEVVFDDVSFTYPAGASGRSGGAGPVLSGFSLEVKPGETVAVVGRTGSGKSTVARLLPRFYDVDSGTVSVDGIDVRRLRLGDLRRAVVVVGEDPFLFATSVHDNVVFGRPEAQDAPSATAKASTPQALFGDAEAAVDAVAGDAVAAGAEAAVDAVAGNAGDAEVLEALADAQAAEFTAAMLHGVCTELGERGADISGGQRQRIAIARALLADPAVLVLDDATSAVDAEVEQRVHAALRRRRSGRTTILITHRLSTVALADRVVFIEDGRVAADGDHHHLLETVPEYAEVLADLADKRSGDASGSDRPAGRRLHSSPTDADSAEANPHEALAAELVGDGTTGSSVS